MMKIKVDNPAIAGAIRTAGALMFGNSIVLPLLTSGDHSWWWLVFAMGCAMIIFTSISISIGEKHE